MSKANREGYFNALPLEIGVADSGENGLATVTIKFGLTEELERGVEGAPDIWRNVAGENLEVAGYFYLEKNNGELNTVAIAQLRDALGWDGTNPFWLQDNAEALASKPVQLRLENEEYNKKTRLKVKYLNPYGREPQAGGVVKATGDKRVATINRLMPKLSAHAASNPAPAAPPPPAPAAPPAAPSVPPPPPVAPPGVSDQASAWQTFFAACPPAWPVDRKTKEWFTVLAKLFPGRQAAQLSPVEWATMATAGVQAITPF